MRFFKRILILRICHVSHVLDELHMSSNLLVTRGCQMGFVITADFRICSDTRAVTQDQSCRWRKGGREGGACLTVSVAAAAAAAADKRP